jgi:serine/threonine protein kinase/Tol biopolymer transport system component
MTPERWRQVEELYHAALERPPDQRTAFLRDACPEDVGLCREVESLLAQEKGADGLLEAPVLQAAAKMFAQSQSVSLLGRQLGHYQLLSLLGAGGMGEVYKARDTRLNRVVAIKVLPPHHAGRPEVRERFDREARTIASLNHPHICALYDIGCEDGIDYLVLEYIEGETLAARLLKGPLPIDQVLRCAIEIADALDKAHRKGITHRDLKPGNVMLTRNGVKLLDFGLAKLQQEAAPAGVPLSQLPTLDYNPTVEGAILGTLQYMAPEQVEGKNDQIDGRTDIFAFGAVVYEMATGKKAFPGTTNASVIGAILKDTPPAISSVQSMSPPGLDRVVQKCLARDPDERWQNAKDLCDGLKWLAEASTPVATVTAPERATPQMAARRLPTGLILAALGGALAVTLAAWLLKPATIPKTVSRLTISLPAGQKLAGTTFGSPVALSRDGTRVAYVAQEGVEQRLYLRSLESQEAVPISGTQGATTPSFSPDGQWLLFFANGRLKKVSVNGGTALPLGDSVLPAGASWSTRGVIGFGFFRGGVQQVPEGGGAPQSITSVVDDEVGHFAPEYLPGGSAILYVAGFKSKPGQWSIIAQSLAGAKRNNLVEGIQPHYTTSGHLLFAKGGTLMAAPFDAQRLELRGSPLAVVESVAESPVFIMSQYSISDNGTLAYISGGPRDVQRRLVWVDRNGAEQALPGPAKAYEALALSPDGRRIAVGLDGQIWTYDVIRDTLSRLTLESSLNLMPVWTPDGTRVAFFSSKDTVEYNMWWQPTNGSGGLKRLTTREYANNPGSFSPDGRLLAFVERNPRTMGDLWILNTDTGKAEPFAATPFNEESPMISPDGRWIAYTSTESGRAEVFVQAFPGPGGKLQISTEGGTEPRWNRNGREIFFRNGEKLVAVDVKTNPELAADKPHELFTGAYFESVTGVSYDVSPDGKKFLMIKATEETASTKQINLVLNWFEELRRRVPAGTK